MSRFNSAVSATPRDRGECASRLPLRQGFQAEFKENTWLDPFKGLEASNAKLKLAYPGRTRSAMLIRPNMIFPLKIGVPVSIPRNFKLQPLKALRGLPLSLIKNTSSPVAAAQPSSQGTPNFSVVKTKQLRLSHTNKRPSRQSHSSMRSMQGLCSRISSRTVIKNQVTRVKSMTAMGEDLLECSFGFEASMQAQL
jgi:hypothetical protein